MIPGFRDVFSGAVPAARRVLRQLPAFAAGAAAAALVSFLAGAFAPAGPAAYAGDDGLAAAAAFREARAELSSGDAAAAGTIYRDLAAAQPLNPAARLMLGIHLQDLDRDPFAAIGEYGAFLRLAPDSEKAALVRERIRACELEIARRSASAAAGEAGAPAAAAAPGDAADAARVRELEGELAAARADAAAAREELAETAVERDGLKRKNDALQKQLAAIKEAGSPSHGPRDDLAARFDRLSTEAGDMPSGPAVRIRPPAPSVSGPDVSGPAVPEDAVRTYKVKSGDKLTGLAKMFYDDERRWTDIRDANPGLVGRDGTIRVGTVLRIPR